MVPNMNQHRYYSSLDKLCIQFDQALKSIFGNPDSTARPYPAQTVPEASFNEAERKHAAGIMRVNHTGEVCAQALYHGQGWVSKRQDVKEKMRRAAVEEGDHLNWCAKRCGELQSHTSYLNPFWYVGSLAIGITAGLVGDEWSLGFLAETEHQVVKHLEKQMKLLPRQDERSYKILQQMQYDEALHRQDAIQAGAKELPDIVKKMMQFSSSVMVKTAYWV